MRNIGLVLLGGCVGATAVAPPGTQIGQEGDEIPCERVVEMVTDPSMPMGDLMFSAADFIATNDHSATGSLVLESGSIPLSLDFEVLDPVEHWFEIRPEGATALCEGEGYQAQIDLTVDAAPELQATHRFDLSVTAVDEARFFVSVDPTGTLEPQTLDPTEWVSIRLELSGERIGTEWEGMASWLGSGNGENRGEALGDWAATVD